MEFVLIAQVNEFAEALNAVKLLHDNAVEHAGAEGSICYGIVVESCMAEKAVEVLSRHLQEFESLTLLD
ncbi:hypothetical protein SAMN02745181_0444 [Rubritalea squalenifaciens DSM 18772]|uniref:Uncharacterized protein n=1 Tax=Rubritalea squalenifaciens DSM 18772 TaxID=1123071 RepID=A0A1M6CC66_9BACT|nr:hypothetical protein SAMN02745181_0444 [Rubritalea squalenifaciens DSM 18772]